MIVRRVYEIGQQIKALGQIPDIINDGEYLDMLNALSQILNTLGVKPNQLLSLDDIVEEIGRLKKLDV